jgi:hypothetical protein
LLFTTAVRGLLPLGHHMVSDVVTSRCRVDLPPPTLLIVIKAVPKVTILGFVLNEGLTATDYFMKRCVKKYIGFCAL